MLTMTVHEMGKELKIGVNSAYELARRADFYPAVKISDRRIIIYVEALKRWLEEQTSRVLSNDEAAKCFPEYFPKTCEENKAV
ncbi:MAG: hypothetical protein ACD_22C00283G0007 [uncultured bacterium]|nr:MAG: hypothetical protein ACD_22C00283G0007 [uncultured bacterium]